MIIEKSNYEKLAAIDVSKHIEKKGNLSYLSWAWAVDQLLRADSKANWVYNTPTTLPDGSMLVSCTVTAFDKSMTMHLPVMDYKNKAIVAPNSFDVNTAMMRCLVKCIALHGLGLYIYAGEDLPEKEPASAKSVTKDVWDSLTPEKQAELQFIVDTVRLLLDTDMTLAMGCLHDVTDAEEKIALWSRFDSKERSKIKATQIKKGN
jgi:hypothetical protein